MPEENEMGVGVADLGRGDLPGSQEAQASTTATDPQPGREVATRKAELKRGEDGYIVPTSVEEAYRYATAVVAARLAPDSYNADPQKVMLGILAAMEAGLPPLYGLRQIAIINGRPTIWGDAAMALIQSKNLLAGQEVTEFGLGMNPDCETAFNPNLTDVREWPDWYGFEVRLFRRGQEKPYVGKFTVGDAKRAHLWIGTWSGKPKVPWMEHPRRMLMIRARAFAQRDGFADALAGLAIREEIEDTFETSDGAVDTAFLDDQPVVEAPPMPTEEKPDAD